MDSGLIPTVHTYPWRQPCKKYQFCVMILNLTQYHKLDIIEADLYESDILCITETHFNFMKVNLSNQTDYINQMRPKDDRKGGGLMMIYKKDLVEIENEETKSKDILSVLCSIHGFKFKLVGVYLSVNDISRNKEAYKELTSLTKSDLPTAILGDFNAHVGFIGKQKINQKMSNHKL